jgi:hypothetical protein
VGEIIRKRKDDSKTETRIKTIRKVRDLVWRYVGGKNKRRVGMPIYEYRCEACGALSEYLVGLGDEKRMTLKRRILKPIGVQGFQEAEQ